METIEIANGVEIPLSELSFSFTRSGGPGGQHVNRVESKVELRWDVANSPTLSELHRARLLENLRSHLTDEGEMRLTSDETRSQHRNRQILMDRFQALVSHALRPRRVRRATQPSAGQRTKRLQHKKQHGEKKSQRRKVRPHEV